MTRKQAFEEGRKQARSGRGIFFGGPQWIVHAFLLGVRWESRRAS